MTGGWEVGGVREEERERNQHSLVSFSKVTDPIMKTPPL